MLLYIKYILVIKHTLLNLDQLKAFSLNSFSLMSL